jgi:cupin 2 domain-containing protein
MRGTQQMGVFQQPASAQDVEMNCPNLYRDIPEPARDEVFESLIQTRHLKLERIISKGHATPPGKWYDEDSEEWVLLLKGSAGLLFEGETEVQVMGPGDTLHIPSHRRHRVEWTDPEKETIWLALHYHGTGDNNDETGL